MRASRRSPGWGSLRLSPVGVEEPASVRISLLTGCFQNAPEDLHKLGERIIEQLRVATRPRLATVRRVVPNTTVKFHTLVWLRWVEFVFLPPGFRASTTFGACPLAFGTYCSTSLAKPFSCRELFDPLLDRASSGVSEREIALYSRPQQQVRHLKPK